MSVNQTFEDYVRMENERIRDLEDFNSPHEVYAMILEEVDEFWDEVKKKQEERNYGNMLVELVQIASTCQRGAESLNLIPPSRLTKGDDDDRISELEDLLNEVLEFVEDRGTYGEPAQKGGPKPYSVQFAKGQIRSYRERLEE